MAMSIIWCVLTGAAFLFAAASGRADAAAAAALSGAGEGVQLAIALAGPMLLWSGFARVCENAGLTAKLARLLRPLLGRIFPKTRDDPAAFGSISANFIANLLGLGNGGQHQAQHDPALGQRLHLRGHLIDGFAALTGKAI